MNEQAAMPIFGGSQEALPGMGRGGLPARRKGRPEPRGPAQVPLLVPAREELPEWPLRPQAGPGQLSFGPNQAPLSEAEPIPTQLSLLPDPPVWEAEPPARAPSPSSGRLARRRSRRGITPGQQPLF